MISNPGKYNIKELVLESRSGAVIDVTRFAANLVIYESIFENTMSGRIGLIESLNLKRHFGLNGDEKVKVSFETEGFDGQGVNTILQSYKISRTSALNDTTSVYSIMLDSPIKYHDKKSRVVESYDANGGAIVDIIFNRYLNKGDANARLITGAKVFNNVKFISPFWRPLEAINWISKRCLNAPPTSAPSYLFFQNADGFHFTNLADLVTTDPVATYTYHQGGVKGLPVGERFFSIENISVGESFDRLRQMDTGVFSSVLLTHDITHKKIQSLAYNYAERFADETHIEKNKIIADANEDFTGYQYKRMYAPKSSFKHNDLYDGDLYEGWVLQRQSIMNQYLSNKLIIEVPGNSLLRAGQVIDVVIPALEPKKGKDWKDPYLSGKYLISDLKHEIVINEQGKYSTTLELIRDSLPQPIADIKEFG